MMKGKDKDKGKAQKGQSKGKAAEPAPKATPANAGAAPAATSPQTPPTAAPPAVEGGSLPLFYRNPVPVDRGRHGSMLLKERRTYFYARGATAVPLLGEEFPMMHAHYPIVFTPGADSTAVALMGFRPNENLFIRDDGSWEPQRPIPAYVRRYPFILMEVPGDQRMVLCVEEDAEVLGAVGDAALFNGDQAGPGAQAALEFCGAFNRSAMATQAFCAAVSQSGILVDQTAEITTHTNQKLTLTGFRVVDEQKFNALPDKLWLDWRQKGWVGLIYTHMLSLGRLEVLTNLTSQRLAPGAA